MNAIKKSDLLIGAEHESVQLTFGNPRYFLFPMEENSTYPAGAATLEYRDVEIEDMAYYTVYIVLK